MKNLLLSLITILIIFFFLGCSSSAQFNKAYLSDEDMLIGLKKIQTTEISSTTYREGASGANGGNTGGGCGCN